MMEKTFIICDSLKELEEELARMSNEGWRLYDCGDWEAVYQLGSEVIACMFYDGDSSIEEKPTSCAPGLFIEKAVLSETRDERKVVDYQIVRKGCVDNFKEEVKKLLADGYVFAPGGDIWTVDGFYHREMIKYE